jgi:hypothetical protein
MDYKRDENKDQKAQRNKANKVHKETVNKIIACIQDTLDFEILMYFIIYRELKLADLEELIAHKSQEYLVCKQ